MSYNVGDKISIKVESGDNYANSMGLSTGVYEIIDKDLNLRHVFTLKDTENPKRIFYEVDFFRVGEINMIRRAPQHAHAHGARPEGSRGGRRGLLINPGEMMQTVSSKSTGGKYKKSRKMRKSNKRKRSRKQRKTRKSKKMRKYKRR